MVVNTGLIVELANSVDAVTVVEWVGWLDGTTDGTTVEGRVVGATDGEWVAGCALGDVDGANVGSDVSGAVDGATDGLLEGICDGAVVAGATDGATLGAVVAGDCVGAWVGMAVDGATDGAVVGCDTVGMTDGYPVGEADVGPCEGLIEGAPVDVVIVWSLPGSPACGSVAVGVIVASSSVAPGVKMPDDGKVARPVGVAWTPHGSQDAVVGMVRTVWVVTASVGCTLGCGDGWAVGNMVGLDENGPIVGADDGGLGNAVGSGLGVGVELAGDLDGR